MYGGGFLVKKRRASSGETTRSEEGSRLSRGVAIPEVRTRGECGRSGSKLCPQCGHAQAGGEFCEVCGPGFGSGGSFSSRPGPVGRFHRRSPVATRRHRHAQYQQQCMAAATRSNQPGFFAGCLTSPLRPSPTIIKALSSLSGRGGADGSGYGCGGFTQAWWVSSPDYRCPHLQVHLHPDGRVKRAGGHLSISQEPRRWWRRRRQGTEIPHKTCEPESRSRCAGAAESGPRPLPQMSRCVAREIGS